MADGKFTLELEGINKIEQDDLAHVFNSIPVHFTKPESVGVSHGEPATIIAAIALSGLVIPGLVALFGGRRGKDYKKRSWHIVRPDGTRIKVNFVDIADKKEPPPEELVKALKASGVDYNDLVKQLSQGT